MCVYMCHSCVYIYVVGVCIYASYVCVYMCHRCVCICVVGVCIYVPHVRVYISSMYVHVHVLDHVDVGVSECICGCVYV